MKSLYKTGHTGTYEIEVDDAILDVEYYADYGEKSTYDYPGSPKGIDLEKVSHAGVDVTDLLAGWVMEKIITEIYEYEFE